MVKIFWEKKKGGTITSPQGFFASGLHTGIKKNKQKFDASLIVSQTPCAAAGTFTTNRVKSWCVLHAMKGIRHSYHRAVLVSSGNANCMNGPQGKKAIEECVGETARLLNIPEEEILTAQTGLIGSPFPTDVLKSGLPKLFRRLSEDGGHAAAKGILTTDRNTKETALSFFLGDKKVTIGAIAKGAGMVHPNMATMLCFITTDAAISKPLLSRAIRHAVDNTFNKISIDNDMSTNDMVFVLANGVATNPIIQNVDRDYRMFRDALEEVCRAMAYKMVKDGEGVNHVCRLRVFGAKNPTEAEKAARQIANSMLFKTMLSGANPNWGRIAAAIGASGVVFNPDQLSISFGNAHVLSNGSLRAAHIPKAERVLYKRDYTIDVTIGKGRGRAEFLTSDLTTKYVVINASYS
ncbi:MAG: bifunctional ornithine acetyltransferase/N-acetylglutamate synthase [Deltaproteobacteria bacterium RIFCSPLOWO2_02_FULL_46_8]|nr:MAG: bifunctional ornithine acetyltransferase/N-acetylglutamate synthase [Deltaproteobacteria bacterium RIFCSPLOWO2_02_FULL_46_8]